MIERLPLNALRAFVVAARHESFKRAALDLHVTPGAISRQIKRLEAEIGTTLFRRGAHGVTLTLRGQELAAPVARHLEGVAEALSRASRRGGGVLSVSAPPSFAQHWLMPRLPAFDAGDAEVAIEASQSLTQPEWQADRVRLAIRFGPEPCAGTGVRVIRLMGDSLFPVCAPSLLEKAPGLTEPADLAAQTLLHVSWPSGYADGRFPGWRTWLDSAGASSVSLRVRQRYSLFTLALDQAIAGHGVALASRAVVADRLTSGVLVAPFGERYALASPFDYWLLLPDDAELPALAARFRDWLIAEAGVFATRR